MNMRWKGLALLVIGIVSIMIAAKITQGAPLGANVTVLNSTRVNLSNVAGSVQAQAGNVSELNIVGTSVTKYWAGYYGNVSGNVVLANADGNNMYRWSVATPRGEIYASRNGTGISWAGVGCANESQITREDNFIGANSGETVDSVNRTFNYSSHPAFSITGRAITGCRSVSVNATGGGNDFWETLLVDNGTQSEMNDDIFIYTGIIDAQKSGFTGSLYDFQMIVGENGNGTEEFPGGNPTTYYFYVELD